MKKISLFLACAAAFLQCTTRAASTDSLQIQDQWTCNRMTASFADVGQLLHVKIKNLGSDSLVLTSFSMVPVFEGIGTPDPQRLSQVITGMETQSPFSIPIQQTLAFTGGWNANAIVVSSPYTGPSSLDPHFLLPPNGAIDVIVFTQVGYGEVRGADSVADVSFNLTVHAVNYDTALTNVIVASLFTHKLYIDSSLTISKQPGTPDRFVLQGMNTIGTYQLKNTSRGTVSLTAIVGSISGPIGNSIMYTPYLSFYDDLGRYVADNSQAAPYFNYVNAYFLHPYNMAPGDSVTLYAVGFVPEMHAGDWFSMRLAMQGNFLDSARGITQPSTVITATGATGETIYPFEALGLRDIFSDTIRIIADGSGLSFYAPEHYTLLVYDMASRTVFNGSCNGRTTVPDLANGIYGYTLVTATQNRKGIEPIFK